MNNGDKNEGPPQDVKNSENDNPWTPSQTEGARAQLSTTPRGLSFDIPLVESLRRWSWWQIVSGKRDEAQGFRGRGWKTAPFVFMGEFGETAGSFGLELNIVNYFLYDLNVPLAAAATMTTNFVGASYVAPLAGAFLADAFLGRFLTFTLGCFIYLAGLAIFTLQGLDKSLRPEKCANLLGKCEQANSLQVRILWLSLVLLAMGSGGVKPCAAPFGADQFDRSNKSHVSQLRHYFNWYYFSKGIAMLTAVSLIIYVQDIGFGWGGIVCIILLATGTILFLCGSPYYIHMPPTGSPLTKMFQVAVAAVRKSKRTLPVNPDNLYEDRKVNDKESLGVQVELLQHTDTLRFLDKAAILEDVDEEPDSRRRYSPWRLAPVHRVEELKMMLKILPIWLATVPVSLVIIQRGTFVTQQSFTMDRRLGTIQIPAASMIIFSIAPLLVFIPIYDLYLIKVLRKLTGHPKGLSDLQRIGVGTFINVLTSIVSALVEKKRRNVAYESGQELQPLGAFELPMSAMWLIPQFLLAGLTELFVIIGQIEFFYDQAPESVRSMSSALFWFSMGIGAFINSIVISTVQTITSHHCPKPTPQMLQYGIAAPCGWIQSNVKLGHLDYFYWFIAVLTVLNFIYFLVVSHWFVYKKSRDLPLDDSEPVMKPGPLKQSTPKA